ncbi:MAG: sulfide/dihydroorotate dehydrogenase-like FAD/NAD-binding protein [Oscillospiraceae bacterium]|jgi:ferredoxin--NADP+ reductase|nr:sulfide/dihydroorotate dehydrogenase-like FAD/NAD-binding protein [Oscillospiraceae bacterium]
MYRIAEKKVFNPQVKLMRIEAPQIAKKVRPGQFIIFRVDETGERIPLTVADADPEKGLVTIIFQEVGKSTMKLGALEAGDFISDFAGPLGVASHLDSFKRVAVIGGGLGCAIAYPQAKHLFAGGAEVDIVAGFRGKELVFFEEEMKACSSNFYAMSDDGTWGEKGLVTDKLNRLIDSGNKYDAVIAIGPLIMMKFVCLATKPHGIKTIVSMNPIMVDGTGMCGACRVTVGGVTRFACVEGPDFDGHLVDFDEAMKRNGMYRDKEKQALDGHICHLREQIKN